MSLNDFRHTNAVGPDTLYTVPGSLSYTYAPVDTPARQVVVESLRLTRLPEAMRSMGWHTAAALMQRWFDSPAWEMPEDWKKEGTQPNPLNLTTAKCDQQIVKMEWAMQFERCREAVKLAESRLTTPNALKRLRILLKKARWREGSSFELGFFNMSALQMDATSQINIAEIGET